MGNWFFDLIENSVVLILFFYEHLFFKGALNPNILNLTINREKFCLQKRFGPIS